MMSQCKIVGESNKNVCECISGGCCACLCVCFLCQSVDGGRESSRSVCVSSSVEDVCRVFLSVGQERRGVVRVSPGTMQAMRAAVSSLFGVDVVLV